MTAYPADYRNAPVKKFIEDFFKASDAKPPGPADGKDTYVEAFESDARLVMGISEFNGREEIAQWRQGAWDSVVTRHHVVKKVFVYSDDEVALVGTVDYGLKNGSSVDVEWSSHMVLNRAGGSPKLKEYHVYLDGSKLTKAIAAMN
jgi:hypothetical protein